MWWSSICTRECCVVEKQIWKDEVSVEVSGSEGRIFNSIIVETKEWVGFVCMCFTCGGSIRHSRVVSRTFIPTCMSIGKLFIFICINCIDC